MLDLQDSPIPTPNLTQNHTKPSPRPLISKQIQTELSMDWMYIGNSSLNPDNNKYNRDKWAVIFSRMKRSQAKRLILGNVLAIKEKNSLSTILKEISHVSF